MTPDHFITVTSPVCDAGFITAMDEEDTFDGRVLANYIFEDSDRVGRYTLEVNTEGYARDKKIEIIDRVPTDTYAYQVLLSGTKVLIQYNGNPSNGDANKISGAVPSDVVPISDTYTIRDNGFNYQRHSYTGWGENPQGNGQLLQPGTQIIPEDTLGGGLVPISPFKLNRSRSRSVSVESLVKAYGVPVTDSENMDGVKFKVDLYAIWDKAPTIDTVAIEFYEGEKVQGKQLKDGLYFSEFGTQDKEDGLAQKGDPKFPHLLDDKTSIRKVSYNPLKNSYRPTPASVSFASDVPADSFYLDTYNGRGMVKDEVVVNKLTFHVEDSKGNITEQDGDVRILYNNFPTLKVPENLILTPERLRSRPLTSNELLTYAKANDIEDDIAKIRDIKYEGKSVNIQNKVVIVSITDSSYNPIKPEFIHDVGVYYVNYSVTDRFGKETLKTMKITSVEPAIGTTEDIKYVRFITLKHLDTLDVNSKWSKDELRAILLNKSAKKTYKFTHAQVLEIKELMKGLRSKADFEGAIQNIIGSYF